MFSLTFAPFKKNRRWFVWLVVWAFFFCFFLLLFLFCFFLVVFVSSVRLFSLCGWVVFNGSCLSIIVVVSPPFFRGIVMNDEIVLKIMRRIVHQGKIS